jgi:AraC-like DNA-binding protein
VRGAHLTKIADMDVEVPPRVPFPWSLGQELSYERTHVDRVQYFLGCGAFRDIALCSILFAGRCWIRPLGRLLGDYMIVLEERLPDVAEVDFSGIAKALGAMVPLPPPPPSPDRFAAARPYSDVGCKERVRRAGRKHLRTPTFGPMVLCRLAGISRSNLYRLFEDSGGVTRYIQRDRLLEAHAMLTDPATTKPVSVIAEDLCFANACSFRRASNGSSAIAPATCSRRFARGWRYLRRCEGSPRLWEEILASCFADLSRARRLADGLRSPDRADVTISGNRR